MIHCPVCNGIKIIEHHKEPLLVYYSCDTCGVMFRKPKEETKEVCKMCGGSGLYCSGSVPAILPCPCEDGKKKGSLARILVNRYGLSSNFAGENDTVEEHIERMSKVLIECGIDPSKGVCL